MPSARRSWIILAALALALVGLISRAIIPSMGDDDLACKVFDDSGTATTDDTDDGGKPMPETDSAKGKCGEFAKAIFVDLDSVLRPSLMAVHALVVCDAATEPLLPDHFLPNAETGPPADIAYGATTAPRAVWLLGSVGTVTRSGRFPRFPPSNTQQHPPIIFGENGTAPRSSPRRFSL